MRLRHASRVLIVRLSALGDCLHVLPALHVLRRELGPAAHIAWLVEEKAASLLAGHPELDRVHILPRSALDGLLRLRRPLASARALGGFFRDLARERFEVAIDFQGNLRSAAAALASGARLRVGFARGTSKEASFLLRNLNVRPGRRRMHKVERNLALVRALGIDTTDAAAVIAIPEAARLKAELFFARRFERGTAVVALHPGVSKFGSFKQWQPERYARVADLLAAERGVRSLITWGPGERALAEEVASRARCAPEIAPETASILELAALYERCSAVVGCDTGPIHLAAAVGVPVVGLYGPKDPAIYAPWSFARSGPVDAIWKRVHCSPCTLRWCGNVICMEAIRPDEVGGAVARALATPP